MKTLFLAIAIVGTVALGPGSAGALMGGDLGPDACKLVGLAALGSDDHLAGAAIVRPGGADVGLWTVRLSTGDVFVGRVTALNCRRNGGGGPDLNVADIEGVGWLNGERGYEFAATMHDHGDGPPVYLEDDFAIMIVKGSTVISTGGLVTWGCITITPIA